MVTPAVATLGEDALYHRRSEGCDVVVETVGVSCSKREGVMDSVEEWVAEGGPLSLREEADGAVAAAREWVS